MNHKLKLHPLKYRGRGNPPRIVDNPSKNSRAFREGHLQAEPKESEWVFPGDIFGEVIQKTGGEENARDV